MRVLITLSVLILVTSADESVVRLCSGFLPENNRLIYEPPAGVMAVTGISKKKFESILERVKTTMSGEVAAFGGNLVIDAIWRSPVANAWAFRRGDDYILEMHGGLARHPNMTGDGFAIVACHELGHHIGGTPREKDDFDYLVSVEGQADYYATLKCFRKIFSFDENLIWIKKNKVNPAFVAECESHFSHDQAASMSCQRAHTALAALAKVMTDIDNRERSLETPPLPLLADAKIGETDQSVIGVTMADHPIPQCRLDTYVNGALCDRDVNDELSNDDYRQGTCEQEDGYTFGFRPRCWFHP